MVLYLLHWKRVEFGVAVLGLKARQKKSENKALQDRHGYGIRQERWIGNRFELI